VLERRREVGVLALLVAIGESCETNAHRAAAGALDVAAAAVDCGAGLLTRPRRGWERLKGGSI
jgi:hypothetical protein